MNKKGEFSDFENIETEVRENEYPLTISCNGYEISIEHVGVNKEILNVIYKYLNDLR